MPVVSCPSQRSGCLEGFRCNGMVGASGFEPPTSRSRTVRSNQAELCPEGEGTRILGESRRPVKRRGIPCDSRRVATFERNHPMKRISTILLVLLAGAAAMAQQQ